MSNLFKRKTALLKKCITSIRIYLFGPKARFKVGECVQQSGDGPLMVIKRVYCKRKMAVALLECQWSEGRVLKKIYLKRRQYNHSTGTAPGKINSARPLQNIPNNQKTSVAIHPAAQKMI